MHHECEIDRVEILLKFHSDEHIKHDEANNEALICDTQREGSGKKWNLRWR